MPRLSVWMVRLAFGYLIGGFTVGALLLVRKGVPTLPIPWTWVPAHAEALVIGWAAQLTLGVAFWIAPRFRAPMPRGDERSALAGAVLMNVGVLLSIAAAVVPLPHPALALGRLLTAIGVIAFAVHLWPRVKPVG